MLKANQKSKENNGTPIDNFPRLVFWSGRTEEAVNHVFDCLVQRPLDAEFIGLLQNTQSGDGDWHNFYRGYGIFKNEGKNNSICVKKDVLENMEVRKRPIVWVFPGAGSQWPTMGRSFLEIPIIRNSVEKLHNILTPKGLDLMEIITSDSPSTFDNIQNTFVAVTAIQIGIVDALKEIGIEPDYIIGHSFGEIACAYADGCLTAEQAILTAYCRGLSINESNIIDGLMAVVAMSADALKSTIPEDIDIACYNTLNLCTIAGPTKSVKVFVEELKSRKIFAREVNSSHVPAHSRYIQKAGVRFDSELSKIILDQKTRSSKWLSTSAPKSEWNKAATQFLVEYSKNNLLNPVQFQEASAMLPTNSLTIEISPHACLQTILKDNLPDALHIPLAKRNRDNVFEFLDALGR